MTYDKAPVSRVDRPRTALIGAPWEDVPQKRVHRTKDFRRTGAIIALVLVIGSAFAVLAALPSSTEAFSPHDPILISGNADFSDGDDDGVIGGSGIATDPYVIDGWSILAGSAIGI